MTSPRSRTPSSSTPSERQEDWAEAVEALRHKTTVLEGHCEAVGRDPATIVRTIGSPVLPIAHERDAHAALERIAPERRAALTPATPERGAEILSGYIEGGFTGFTFGNTMLPTNESIAVAGATLRLLAPRS